MDDEDDDYQSGRTPFPTRAKVAGVLWILFGCLGLISVVANLAMIKPAPPGGAGNNSGGICCGAIFAIVFLHVGLQTLQGKAKDTLGNGIGSIVFGLFYLALAGGVVLAANRIGMAMAPEVVVIVAGIVGSFALMLISAGTMALVCRQQYKEWRRENRPNKKRRRREDDEDEDEPDR